MNPQPSTGRTATATDPGLCLHRRVRRLGIQRAEFPPWRLHLVVCAICGTTVTTETLRGLRPPRR